MSSLTVQVIFMGLIGLVPHEEGQVGMTALMVDPAVKGEHKHVPYIFLLEGGGECHPVGGSNCFRDCDDDKFLGKKVSNKPKLCWKLDDEDLKILGDQSSLKVDRTGYRTIFGNLKEVPRWKWQANDYAWVPGMDLLTGGYGRVQDSCLADGKPCNLVRARMRLRGGRATACHLIHDDTEYAGNKRNVIRFPYQVEGRPPINQAVADAARVEFQVEGDEVYLHSWSFDKDGGQEPHKAFVTLKPSGQSRTLTLIVTNFPVSKHYPKFTDSNFHAEIFFKLLALAPPVQPTRTNCVDAEPPCEKFLRYPGSCEPQAKQIEVLFEEALDLRDLIHSPTYCDGVSFQRQ